ncbi:putative outer membrane protein [Streptomyces griseochromogenes]|uniref:Outer membrane protein n=1 Tax=Streptomyces griseochromogenes TaxID=68214 RepID=A0ABS4LTL9_9ACTN|nr:putative outer membrane protein [Streptomyces griseochromogenes]
MRFSRNATGTLFVGGAMALTLAALAYPSMLGVSTVSSSPSRVIAQTQWGPLTEGDRDFVVKVRAAGLWEYPVGQIGLQKGTTKGVIEASKHLVDGHAALDTTCRKIAPMLNITLPNIASPQQEGFVTTLKSDSGKKFDSDFANILRMTHGSIFNTVAKIRSTTKNSLVRALADQANDTVLDHITVMEKTGLVDFDQTIFQQTTPPKLPASDQTPPPPPAGQPQVVLTPPPNATSKPVDIDGIAGGNGGGGASPGPSPSPTVG